MAKFNTTRTRAAVSSPITTESTASGRTYEGAPGFARDTKSELFLLAVSNMVGEDTFYERARSRDDRYTALIRQVAVDDTGWTLEFLRWLRGAANMRSTAVVGAAEAVHARLAAAKATPETDLVSNGVANRVLISTVLQRADEPGELLAYWISTHGRAVPKPVKRGIEDSLARLYTERSLLKYDTASHGFRFGDVIELVHPAPSTINQGNLFEHAIDRRHGRDNPVPEGLEMLQANVDLMGWATRDRRELLTRPDAAFTLRKAGITWEALASWLQGPMDAAAWSAVIPSMGYMALLRNLRNFDEAGVPDEVAERVIAKLTDPEEVAGSRQLPFRFFSAYREAPSLRWGHALDRALTLATSNIPAFTGRTLVLVDTSASMTTGRLSRRSTVSAAQAAALFGVSLAARGNSVDLVGFADGVFRHPVGPGASVLRSVERFVARTGEVGHGTEIAGSLRATYSGHHRVVIISDMQTRSAGVDSAVPAHVPIYGFNLGGYAKAAMPTGNGTRHEIGGLSDATFRLLPLLEAGRSAAWPWQT